MTQDDSEGRRFPTAHDVMMRRRRRAAWEVAEKHGGKMWT